MKTIKNPAAGEPGAERETIEYRYYSLSCSACQPASWLIRENFIENLVSKPYSTERSRRVDLLLIFSDFLEGGADYACN